VAANTHIADPVEVHPIASISVYGSWENRSVSMTFFFIVSVTELPRIIAPKNSANRAMTIACRCVIVPEATDVANELA
jgi:hypothetical protein